MAWNVIRTATTEDKERLEASAQRFCERYGIPTYGDDAVSAITNVLNPKDPDDASKYRNWIMCVRRALKDGRATGIAYDYVGYSAE